MKNGKKYIILVAITILISVIALASATYALLTMTVEGDKKITITAGTLRVDFTDGNFITLENQAPTSDTNGLAKTPYTFTITNTGNLNAYYTVSLEEEITNTLSNTYIKMKLTSDNGYDSGVVTVSDLGTTTFDLTEEALIEPGTDNAVTYSLWMWLSNKADNNAQGKEYKSKIVVTSKDRPTETALEPGLYKDDGTFVSWEQLKAEQIFVVEDGVLQNVQYNENYDTAAAFVISDEVTIIAGGAFSQGHNYKKIIIPNSVVEIGGHAFQSCWSIESIAIPDSVTIIGQDAFFDCTALTTIYYSGTAEFTGVDWDVSTVMIKPYSEAPAELLPSA